ncbi:MAG: NGG1p interacting factor NIF3 [Candidatus Omnitrophica bacterium]|nr:NGG1p interacting factor NIF3 [Candidatus Omnitrophota bacterium]MDD5352336.1 NGG1p interacting factor NIF3 [Candidatus Omnitrophota bacterium]MDD5549934.1 NGG1p interacting factor NIF3 [Candidatus Omnitrophota bacterium]
MKLKDIYRIAVEEGIKQDPRGKDAVGKELKQKKDAFEALSKEKRKEFDMESLHNPYPDTRILYGDGEKEIKSALVGIDIDAAELLLIDRLKKNNINLCISHHPEGVAWAGFYEVMGMQADILARFGVPINVGEDLLQERMNEVARKVHAANHNRAVDAARLLDIPFMCMHTVADNFASSYLQNLMDKKKPETVEDIITILKEIPEYQLALQDKAGPKVILGDTKRKAGKIIVEMTGGTEGHKEIFDNYIQAGIGTIIAMHLSEEHFQKAKGKHINIIIAGHIASDSLGLNFLLDKIQQRGKLQITACSGFRRIERK